MFFELVVLTLFYLVIALAYYAHTLHLRIAELKEAIIDQQEYIAELDTRIRTALDTAATITIDIENIKHELQL